MLFVRFCLCIVFVLSTLGCQKWDVPVYEGLVDMVFIKGGSFNMGSNEGDDDEKPVHKVTVNDFYMGKYEITYKQYETFINESGYRSSSVDSYDWKTNAYLGSNHPVVLVSHIDAKAFCNWLSKKEGRNYRLPTEAEWEYAAGNGNKQTKFSMGNNLYSYSGNLGIFAMDGKSYIGSVGGYGANELGLYDMTGNVYEITNDYYSSSYYSVSPTNNPTGPLGSSNEFIVIRGGSYLTSSEFYARIAYRNTMIRNNIYNDAGFRIVATEK